MACRQTSRCSMHSALVAATDEIFSLSLSTFVSCSDANDGFFSVACFVLSACSSPVLSARLTQVTRPQSTDFFGGSGKLRMRNKLVFNF